MEIREYFDLLAPDWGTCHNQKTFNSIKSVLLRMKLNPKDKILDVGAGTGVLVPFFLPGTRKNITAIDISEEMALEYSKKFPAQTIEINNYEKPKIFRARSFNKIIIFNAFPHFRNPVAVFNNSYKYLRKNGKLVIAHSMSREELNKHHAGSSVVKDDVLIPDAGLCKLYLDAGFTDIEIENGTYFYSEGTKLQ